MPPNMSCGWDLQGCCGWAYLAPCWSSSRLEPPRDVWGSGMSLATPPCCQCSALTFTFRGRRSWRCLQCADALGGAVSSHQHRGFPDWNTTLHCWKTRRLTLPSSGCQGPRYQSVILHLVSGPQISKCNFAFGVSCCAHLVILFAKLDGHVCTFLCKANNAVWDVVRPSESGITAALIW